MTRRSASLSSSLILIGCAVVLVIAGGAPAAGYGTLTFPGKNGRIAFNSEGSIFLVDPDGSDLTRLASTNSQDTNTGVSFSRDGTRLAYSGFRGSDPDIYVIGTNGRGARQVTFSRGVDVDPTWSPAGRIAFETNRHGNVDIYSVDDRGRTPQRLTTGPEDDLDPAWSPRGDKIAYTVESGESRQIYVMNSDGSGKRQLTDAANVSQNPGWSPDGTRIVFDSDRVEAGDLEIYSMKADGTDVRRLTNHPALDALPTFSPDGRRIAFVSDRAEKDSRRLYVMAADGRSTRLLIRSGGPSFQMVPDWQPLRAGRLEPAPVPPGRQLAARGVSDRVDPLYDLGDAWSVRMAAGTTYRINLSATRGCAAVTVFAPGTRSFSGGRRLAARSCGGYFTFTPGPDGGGRHTLLVTPAGPGDAVIPYRLQVAPAGQDDQGPGVGLVSGQRRAGALSARGIDVVDLYRFDVRSLSTVRIDFESLSRLDLELTTVTGEVVARSDPGTTLRQTLKPGTYLVALTAPARVSGRYALTVLVRVVTKTTLSADDRRAVTTTIGEAVTLRTDTTPPQASGRVRIRADYLDPRAGWVFREAWVVSPGSSVRFAPPAVGRWRVAASYFGTSSAAPSRSGYVTIDVGSG